MKNGLKYSLFLFFLMAFQTLAGQEVKQIILKDTTYTFVDPEYELMMAASEGDTMKIRAFLSIGTAVNSTTWDGVTPLMYAAQNGHLPAVEMLLDAEADINVKPYNFIDALLGATIAGHVLVADTLILNGAKVNTRSLDGVTPLMYAAAYNHYLLSDVLLFYGADVNTTDNFGNYPIHFSCFYGNIDITALLLSKGADINSTDVNGFTPLMVAAQNGHAELVAYLVESGAETGKTNEENCTALSLAILERHSAIVDYLLSKGADPNHQITDQVNHYELSREMAGKDVTAILGTYDAKPLKPFRVNKLLVEYDLNWNNSDIMMGGHIGLLESAHGWEAMFGYRTRPWVRSIRYEIDQQVQYQFWEKRSLWYLGAGKRFTLVSPGARESFGAFANANLGYTYGSFRGSDRNPEDQWIFLPKAGLFYQYKVLDVKLGYEYMSIRNSTVSPHRLTLNVGVAFSLIKTNFKQKREPRL
jgi:ankyrin repeat protein